MLRLPNHEIASHTRPSLFIRYLMAIGPGTIIVKKAQEGTRNDGTSCELLQYHLSHYSYLALPDGHYPFVPTEKSKPYRAALTCLTEKRIASDEDWQTYLRHKPIAKDVIARWAASDCQYHTSATNKDWADWLENKVFVPESGPVVIVGSPESYLSYQCPFGEDTFVTPFRRLLSEAGYSTRYKLEMSVYGGAFHHGTVQTPLHRNGSTLEHDIGLIFMGRTPAGRTVIVLAGATCPFGTFAAVRLATDYGRNEINSMAMEFFEGNSSNHCATAFFAKRVWRPDQLPAFGLQDPIGIEFIDQMRPASTRSDLAYRRLEVELQALDTTPAIPSSQRTAISELLSSKGPVNIITKWYPHDLRDDAHAMQILEYSLDDSINYPVAAEITDYFEEHMGGPRANGQDIFGELNRFKSPQASPVAQAIGHLDDETTKLFELWRQSLEESSNRSNPSAFSAWLDRYYRIPSDGATIVLGAPESFLGFEHALVEAPKPKLAALLHSAQYPNRYQLRLRVASDEKYIGIFDHKKRRVLEDTEHKRFTHTEKDAGFISLSKGANGRDILAIVGSAWLGTLAGVRLLFTQQRPSIDALIQAYASGERQRVDIYFTCARAVPAIDRKKKQDAAWQHFDDPKDLVIDTHNSELEPEFQRNRLAEKLFAGLFADLDEHKAGAVTIETQEQAFFDIELSRAENKRKLTIDCKQPIDMGDKDPILCGSVVSTVFQELAYCVRQDAPRLTGCFCGKYFVLGAPGVGKESFAQFIHQELSKSKQAPPLVTVNAAGLASELVLSELFGHVRGAYTGATVERRGRFQAAYGGVVFLDEFAAQHVSDKNLQEERDATRLQTNLLRVMESYTYSPVGSDNAFPVNCLFVAATNIAPTKDDLKSLIKRGYFRQDIRDRFEGRIFELPPLAARPLEILPGFVQKIRAVYVELGKTPPEIEMSVEAIKLLLMQPLPANFRDLVKIAQAIVPKLDGDHQLASHKQPLQIMSHHLLEAMDEEADEFPSEHEGNEMVRIEILAKGETLDKVRERTEANKPAKPEVSKRQENKDDQRGVVLPTEKLAKRFGEYNPKKAGYFQSGGNSKRVKNAITGLESSDWDWRNGSPSELVEKLSAVYENLTRNSAHTSPFTKVYHSVLRYFPSVGYEQHRWQEKFVNYQGSQKQVNAIIKAAKQVQLCFDFLAVAMAVCFGIEIREAAYKQLCFEYRNLMKKSKETTSSLACRLPNGEFVHYTKEQIADYIDKEMRWSSAD